MNAKRGPDAQLTVAQVRESIVKFNGFDTDPAHAKDKSYDSKSVYRLQVGQEIKLPSEYAAALHQANQTLAPEDKVTVTGGELAPVEPQPPAAPAPEPTDGKQAAADLGGVVDGGQAKPPAEPAAEKKGPWATFGDRIGGSGLFRRDPEKVAAREAARAERKEDREHRVAERKAEHDAKVADRQHKHEERVAAREEARTERKEARSAAHDERVAARADSKEQRAADRETREQGRIDAATAKRKEDETRTAGQQRDLDAYKAELDPEKYATVIEYIDSHKGHRPSRVLDKAEEMVADIDRDEDRAVAKHDKEVERAAAKQDRADAKQAREEKRSDAQEARVAARDERQAERSAKREAIQALRADIRGVRADEIDPKKAKDVAESLLDTEVAVADE